MRRADYLKNLYQLVRLCTELLAKTFILVLLVPLRRQREAAAPGEQRLHAPIRLQRLQQLRQNASDRPDVDLRVVVVLQQDQFRGAVPASYDVLRQLPIDGRLGLAPGGRARNVALPGREGTGTNARLSLISVLVVHLAREAEVDDFQFTLVVYKDIRWFQITMHNIATLVLRRTPKRLPAYTISHKAIGK